MRNKNGVLVISLDFELLWGLFDVVNFEEKKSYFENTRAIIPSILSEFSLYNIHATWATVGMLFNKNWKQWEQNLPSVLPEYSDRRLNPYHFGNRIKSDETEKFCFAQEIVVKISATPGQEIGTHTYSHYYCLEEGQRKESFREDLIMAIEVAESLGIKLKSLVFPRNQLLIDYLKICFELGITNVRSNPSSWYWKDVRSNTLSTRLARTGDAYFPLGKKYYPYTKTYRKEGLPLEQKASRFFRPVENNSLLHKLKLLRVMNEMTVAAKKGEVYHLWWHPHNFGNAPQKSINDLKLVMSHYENLRKTYGFQSLNMREFGEMMS